MQGWAAEPKQPEFLELYLAWCDIAYMFAENFAGAQTGDWEVDEGIPHFSTSSKSPSKVILDNFEQRRGSKQKQEYVIELIQHAVAPLRVDGTEDYYSQTYDVLEAGINRFLRCSIESAVGKTTNNNFRTWMEEAVDPIMKAIQDERKAMEGLLAMTLPMSAHISALLSNLEGSKVDDLIGENQGSLVAVYKAMHDAFERHGLIAINQLATVPKDVHRISQIETIIDLYTKKIDRVKNDAKLSEEEKDRKLQAWEHLMEKDIDALGGAV